MQDDFSKSSIRVMVWFFILILSLFVALDYHAILLLKESWSAITTIIAFSALLKAYSEYLNKKKRKIFEYKSAYIFKFYKDQELMAFVRIIENKSRRIPIPEEYQCILGKPFLDHHVDKLARAEKLDTPSEPEVVVYRDLMDNFFYYLCELNFLIKERLISIDEGHYAIIKYKIASILEPGWSHHENHGVGQRDILAEYIKENDFNDVIELALIYGTTYSDDSAIQEEKYRRNTV